MFDGRVQIFERLKRADTAVVIPVMADGRIVYSWQEQPGKAPFLGALGGRLDEGEDALQAAKRELLEEAGLEADGWSLFDAKQPLTKIDWCVFTFIAKGCRRVAEQELDGGEKIELRFATFDEFFDMVIHQPFVEEQLRVKFLEAALDPRKLEELRRLFG